MPECLFCAIVAGEVPATIVSETPRTIAFTDINPQAPVHVLVIPRQHLADLSELSLDPELLHAVTAHAIEVSRSQDAIFENGFRVVFNNGPQGGQTVGHVHAHILGGRQLTWPPG